MPPAVVVVRNLLHYKCTNCHFLTVCTCNRWLSYMHAYLTISLCVVPLPPSCETFDGSCEHYEECVEPLLSCGEHGFTLAYGKQHCEIIQQLQSNSSMPSWMLEWLNSHEMCLQRKVFELATAQSCSNPDPISCLQFEASALVAFEECFTRNVSLLCDSSELTDNPTMLANHVTILAQLLGINDYYRNGILETVARAVNNSCNHPNATHVVNSVRPSSNRVFFCAVVSGDNSVVNSFSLTSYVDQVAGELGRPVEQFRYAGSYAGRLQELCHDNAPAALGNVPNLVFHYVTWEPENEDTLLHSLEESYFLSVGITSYFDFYPLDSLHSHGQCGDAIRQAGELCDTGVNNFFGLHGCNSSCMPCDEYECNTVPLNESTCYRTECGDGLKTSNEECDDGNSDSGDGCANCRTERGYVCDSPYNATSSCTRDHTMPPTGSDTTATSSSSSSQSTTATTRTVTTTTRSPTGSTSPPLIRDRVGGSASSLNCFTYSILLIISLLLFVLSH